MKRRSIAVFSIFLPAAISFPIYTQAADKITKISVAQMPALAENKEKGVVINFLKAMEKASGQTFDIVVQPFARSIGDAIEGRADAHFPLLQAVGAPNSTGKFDYSTEVVYPVNFVLYTKKGSSFTPDTIKTAKIETDIAHTDYFDFSTTGSSDLLLSLKKVDAGRIDGVIFADNVIDPIIKSNNLTGLKRSMYKVFNVKFVLPKGGNGGSADKAITAAIAKLKASGEWSKLTEAVGLGRSYDNWQP